MANYDITELHRRTLAILRAVDATCREHQLTYYIWAGTMLGAVRHHGFIPWDDDVDIAMPRPDYEKLIANCCEWLPSPYEMVCAENDPAYPLPFAKIQDSTTTLIERRHLPYLGGIYIDVFPIDGTPRLAPIRRLHFAAYEYYKRVLYLLWRDPYKRGTGASSWIPRLCRRIYTLGEVQRKIRRLLTAYSFDRSRLVADYDDGARGAMTKHVLGTPLPYSFEGETMFGVAEADRYLAQKYGNYMQIPPEAQRRQHRFHYLDLHSPYREYSNS